MHETNTGTVGPPEPHYVRSQHTKINGALKCCVASLLYSNFGHDLETLNLELSLCFVVSLIKQRVVIKS